MILPIIKILFEKLKLKLTFSPEIVPGVFTIKKLSTENRELYGSVKPTEISKIIKQFEDLQINPSLIQPSKEIKSLGTFDVILNLHSDIQSQIKITVVAQEENQ